MKEFELEKYLVELGGMDRPLLAKAVIVGAQQLESGKDVSMQDIYETIAQAEGIPEKEVRRRMGVALGMLGYRGNLPKVEETFGRRYGRIHVTPKNFVKTMATKFGGVKDYRKI